MRKILLLLGIVIMVTVIGVILLAQNSQQSQPTLVEQSVNELVTPQQTVTMFDGSQAETVDSDAKIQSSFAAFYADSGYDNSFGKFSGLGLSNVLAATGATAPPSLLPILDQKQWDIYKCDSTRAEYTPIALSLTLAPGASFSGNLYQRKLSEMSKWEDSLAENLAPLLFPLQGSGEYVQQSSRFFADTTVPSADIRIANIFLTNGVSAQIGYLTIGADIIVSNSLDCLLQVQTEVFDLEA